ncbi:DUF5707 domain-containing protein [Streptomyces sp. C11-1]|uniref:DUF5707 domain-containing protein n=1 Tax=Streptomyces durocortorensis TaxID=2811104 RepID=A0ABY9VYL1_9ACTN|nr:DUF5707 domain-containing protein [Streptomyces durocortorensis]WNF28985.1 DUF5707 domain-containing protein [Streptomyces durocortorensis]
MPKRAVTISALAGVALLAGAGAYAFAGEARSTGPEVTHASVAYVAPGAGQDGSLTFTAEVADDSGVRGLKVLAWPTSMAPAPNAEEMAHAEPAACEPAGAETARCTYTVKVTAADAAESPKGAWNVAVLASAKDGGRAFAPKAADFTVEG